VRVCDNYSLMVLNDGQPTFISASGQASSTIDLTIASRDLGLLSSVSTLRDLHGSDHFPVSISVAKASPSSYKFSNRLNLTGKQLISLHGSLAAEFPRFQSSIPSSAASLDLLQTYEMFCSFLSKHISLFFPQGILPPRKKLLSSKKLSFPWWNSTCDEAVEHRRTLLRLYKASPSLDNWLAFKRGNTQCRKVLRREKRREWRLLCSEFSFKTPTAAIWRFMRAYKNKSFSSEGPPLDEESKINAQDQLLSKLCPPSCLHSVSQFLANQESVDSLNDPIGWIDSPF